MSDLLPELPTLPAIHAAAVDAQQTNPFQLPTDLPNPIDYTSGVNGPGNSGAIGHIVSADPKSTEGMSFTWARVAAFVVGLLLIGGGVIAFKQTQVIISGAAKGAAGVAAL